MDEAQELSARARKVLFRLVRGHRIRSRHGSGQDGKIGVDALLIQCVGAFRTCSCKGEGETPRIQFFGAGGKDSGGFAPGGLCIKAAFARDEDVGIDKFPFNASVAQDERCTGRQCAVQVRVEGEPESASSASTGKIHIGFSTRDGRFREMCEG